MNGSRLASAFSLCVLALLALAVAAAAQAPIPVSPGSTEGFSSAASPCPTFSWSAVEGASGYELVVYSTAGGDPAAAGNGRGDVDPVIRQRLPGGALSWTPPAASCLELAGSYAWSVRAVGLVESGPREVGPWSESALFKVDPGPALDELVLAVERALGRYLESRGLVFQAGGEMTALIAEELGRTATPAASSSETGERIRYQGGKRLLPGEPEPRGVFAEDVELWLEEAGSGAGDHVQLVFATPEFDGDPVSGDAWSISVSAYDSASPDDGTMKFTTPGFADALQLYTDGTAVSELRYLTLRKHSSPPLSCVAGQEGKFYWDTQANTLCVCVGSSGWEPLDSDNTGTCN